MLQLIIAMTTETFLHSIDDGTELSGTFQLFPENKTFVGSTIF